jgi:hypothetical protein
MVPPAHRQAVSQLRAVFDRDHARLLELLADVQFLCTRRSYLPAAKVFSEFRMRQERHLHNEEALLEDLQKRGRIMPALLKHSVAEHVVLRQRIERTWDAVCRNDNPAFDREVEALSEALDEHEHGEKDQLLPALLAAISEPNEVANDVHRIIEG